jgi:hypothetical protein
VNFEEFQNLARLYVVGALDESEITTFDHARRQFGETAEDYIREARQLNAAFALSLRPQPVATDAKEKLMALIRKSGKTGGERLRT